MNEAIIEVDELIKELKMLLLSKAESKNLICSIEVEETVPKQINCDIRRMLQLLLNLGFNAIKYTFSGRISIQLYLNRAKTHLTIKVADTGIGIPKMDLEQINKLFGLIDKKIAHHETGIGIGFMISKNIVNAMKGELNITSVAGEGTTCKVRLPLTTLHIIVFFFYHSKKNEEMVEKCILKSILNKHEEELNSSEQTFIRHPKILVVDDDPIVQLALSSMLSKLDCITEKAMNGQLAIDMVNTKTSRGEAYDIIFMDVNMPVMNGYEATKVMKKDLRLKTPVICSSAQDSSIHLNLCKNAGMDDIVYKPFTVSQIKRILNKYHLK